MISKTFTKRALMGLGAGAMALGAISTTGCMREANAADSATPSKIEQVSYSDVISMSANGVVVHYGENIEDADATAKSVARREQVEGHAVGGYGRADFAVVYVFGQEIGEYDQDGLDGGDAGADATIAIRDARPKTFSSLRAEP